MYAGIRPAGPQHFFNSFFGYAAHSEEPTDTPPRSTRIHITPVEGEEGTQCADQVALDPEQLASAAIRAQEEEAADTFGSGPVTHLSHSISAPQIPDQVSVSPAAMFLSTFSSPPAAAPASLPDAEGQVISGYTLGSIIGYGAFSTIRQASSNSGGIVAVKIVRRSDLFKQGNVTLARKRIKREAAVWSTLSHEHVLPLFSVVHTSYSDYFFTLLCPAGSLYDILKRDGRPALPQDDAGMMFRQVVRGLRYLHEVALFVHRDIKLENVLVDENGVCRIGDFGMTMHIGELDEDEVTQEQEALTAGGNAVHRAVSLIIPSSRRQPMVGLQAQISRHRNSTSSPHPATSPHIFQPGSLPYASPELLLPQTSGPLLPHPAQDIWALGILLYGLLMGRLPFVDSFEPRLQMKILNGVYEVPPGIGRGAERVIKGCLDRSVHTRWSIAMVDEVAWGIGWGTEGDDVTPAESDDEYVASHPDKPAKNPSRSRSRRPEQPIPENPQWQHDERRSRPSIEVASRRSSSRMQRSISRAPVLTSRSSSGRNMMGRSMSRHSRAPSPTFSGLNNPILVNPRSTTPSRTSVFQDSALVTTPPLSLERGRRLRKVHGHSPSPSPSPSAVPSTPTDSRSLAPTEVLETDSDDFERESSRGRRKFSRGAALLNTSHLFSGDTTSELDVLDETVGWAPPTAPHKRSVSIAGHSALSDARVSYPTSTYAGWNRFDRSPSKPAVNRVEAYFEKNCPGSASPAPTSFWSLAAGKFTIPRRTPKSSADKSTSVTISASALGVMTRSKSLEYDRDASYLRRGH
ncbi:kinase-like domain-containing protein [Collybia nuda]|uniref:Kinase-like domain-containing protein n=1 Tax=Collybia nuda TaxID=64659 RepID=A0A9P6CJC1_9AGAR|nr:kinase-like domain-containing protein [Collybia nuda]